MSKCPCSDCQQETNHTDQAEWYMVLDSIWAEATKEVPAKYLCIGCLEKRLNRQLTHKDFNCTTLANFLPDRFSHSERLKDRLKDLVFDEEEYARKCKLSFK